MGQFEAGAAKGDITPDVGVELAGYSPRVERTNRSTGINDPIWIRALALRSGESSVLILVMDLLGIELPTTDLIRSLIAEKLHIAPDGILVSCTHNHSAPSLLEEYEEGILVDEAWKKATINAAVNVAEKAFASVKPALIGASRTEVGDVGANRKVWLDDGSIFHYIGLSTRVPPEGRTVVKTGIIDPELAVLCVKDRTDRLIAVLVNYACHPWIYNGNRVSSEVSGACVELVEDQLVPKNPDVIAIFTPGAGSNITTIQHQVPIPDSVLERERWFASERLRLGGILSQATLQVVRGMTEFAGAGPVTSELCRMASPAYDKNLGAVIAENDGLPPTDMVLETEAQVIKIGQVVLVGLPSEVYVEIGLDIKKRSRYQDTFVISQSNDYFADIITEEAVKEGCCPELEWTRVHPGIRDLIMGCLEHRIFKADDSIHRGERQ